MPYNSHIRNLLLACAVGLGVSHAIAEEPSGLRKLTGEHLTLYTDLPASQEVDALPQVFDAAVEPWREYFSAPPSALANWHVVGCLIQHHERFVAAGLIPPDLPDFLNGRNVGNKFWINEQPDAYYRRHLMLHEGTHCVMEELFKERTPPWYWEGMAELLATHQLKSGQVQLAYFPISRKEVPYLGRIQLVQEAMKHESGKSLVNITAIPTRDYSDNLAYAWSWAATAFLQNNPRSHKNFLAARQWIGKPDFNRHLVGEFGEEWPHLQQEWQVYLANLDYGYDFQRMGIDFSPGEPLAKSNSPVRIRADRGWQSAKLILQKGVRYNLSAQGTFQIARTSKPWISTAEGVTIRYERGQPLGKLLAAVLPKDDPSSTALVQGTPVGADGSITPETDGTLYLRVNDSAAELADNSGEIEVAVRQD